MKLYNYFRSSTSHRLRIACNLKGLAYDYIALDLRRDEHLHATFAAINPQKLVPALDTGEQVLIQSPAIIEWLEEAYPNPPLLPPKALDRAHVRALAALVGCDVHPLNNRRVLQYLRAQFGANEAAINTWSGGWIAPGFDAYEALLVADKRARVFSFGDAPTVADVYLIPQIESARRFEVNLTLWPHIARIEQACLALPAFQHAAPQAQVDAAS